jgi:hypothetical protein
VSLLLLLTVCLAALSAPDDAARPGPRVYTNDDLDRVSARRAETGVLSTAPVPAPSASPASAARHPHGEDYWRREAERLRDRLEPLRERADDLRARIEERRRAPGVRPYTDGQVQALQRRLAAVEARIRDLESQFGDRARREGALPGWLR